MKSFAFSMLLLFLAGELCAAEKAQWVKTPALTFDANNKVWHVTFELAAHVDVEVAIVNRDGGTIVRHLAAGVLGSNAPPPLVPNSLAQKLVWDGKDDYGNPVRDMRLMAAQVRVGMSVQLEQIVGGDPYAFYSDEMGDNDHSPWGINGLVAKPDGKVYVWGHSSNLGPPALRQYDIDGNYLSTLFPMPAGKKPSEMEGWGIHVRPDGTYTPQYNLIVDPSLTTTFLDTNLRMARLLPTPKKDRLTFWRASLAAGSFDLMTINTDGTIASDVARQPIQRLIGEPPLALGPVEPNSHIVHSLLGPVFEDYSQDGKTLYLSGLYAATTRYGSVLDVKKDGFWRDGQVWKVDVKTGVAKVFFALDEQEIPTTTRDRNAAYGGSESYAALHGVTTDAAGNVFVCDRLHKRIVVLDQHGKTIHEIPVEHPDAIAFSKTGALYITTRHGDYHRRGVVQLLKINDWRKDSKPSQTIEVSKTGYTGQYKRSYLAVCDTDQGSNVWVAWTQMPVRIYRDKGDSLQLLKDFYRVDGAQRCLGFDRLQVDPQTDEAYLHDAHDAVWKIADWQKPKFVKVPLETADLAIDARHRWLFTRTQRDGSSSNSVGKVARFQLDQADYPAANYGETKTNRVTESMQFEWCFEGNSDKGLAVAPNGNLAVVGAPREGLRVFSGGESKVPWTGIKVADLPADAGGVRFDLAGNLYVGYVDKRPPVSLPGFENDPHFSKVGRIHKYAPTGTLASGNLFPTAPRAPLRTYDVPYGAFQTQCVTRGPRFGVDGYGRIYFPTNIVPRVTVIDNNGNEILRFGTYGNRDSLGGLPGDRVPTQGIPLAFPNSVDATDNHIYVADMVNLRILRLRKEFQLTATSP